MSPEGGALGVARSGRACALCGSHMRPAWRRRNVPILRCQGCGLLAVDPLPTTEELRRTYDKPYFDGAHEYLPYASDERLRRQHFERLLGIVERYTDGGQLLDVGCATGLFLAVLPSRWAGVGLDISRYACEAIEVRTGRAAMCGDLTEAELPPESFDAVTMWSLIEHTRDPLGYLAAGNRLLRQHGVLALTTGDAGSLFARLTGSRWRLVIPDMHLYYFSRTTIARALEACGFDVLQVSSAGKVVSMCHLLYILYSATGWTPLRRWAALLQDTWLGRLSLYVSVGDVMLVLARKAGAPRDAGVGRAA